VFVSVCVCVFVRARARAKETLSPQPAVVDLSIANGSGRELCLFQVVFICP